MEQASPPKARTLLDETDPRGEVARAGVLRRGKKGKEFYCVLWPEPLQGTKHSRLDFFSEEKAFHKQKSPKKTIPIVDMAAVYTTEAATEVPNSFSILLTDQETIVLIAASPEDKDFWAGLLLEFVTRRPNAKRLGYDWHFSNVQVCPKELGQVTGLAVVAPVGCTIAFNATSFAVLYPLRHKARFVCPIKALRSCGYNNEVMYIHCGRRAPCGEGKLYFQTENETIARQIKDCLYGEMCRGASTMRTGSSSSASVPVKVVHSQSNNGHPYSQEFTHRTAQSYTDGCPPQDQFKGHRPRAEAITKQYGRQISDPHSGMRINGGPRNFGFQSASVDSMNSNDLAPNSLPNPGYVTGKPQILSGYEDMAGKAFVPQDYEDMSASRMSYGSRSSFTDPRASFGSRGSFHDSRGSLDISQASFEGSRTGDYANIVPNGVSRSYSSPRSSTSSSVLNGLDAHMSSLSMRADEHAYQNIDPHRAGTRFVMVPASAEDIQHANLKLNGTPPLPGHPQTQPIFMPSRRTSIRSQDEALSHPQQSWHNQVFSADKGPEEIFPFDNGSPNTPSPELIKRSEICTRAVAASS